MSQVASALSIPQARCLEPKRTDAADMPLDCGDWLCLVCHAPPISCTDYIGSMAGELRRRRFMLSVTRVTDCILLTLRPLSRNFMPSRVCQII